MTQKFEKWIDGTMRKSDGHGITRKSPVELINKFLTIKKYDTIEFRGFTIDEINEIMEHFNYNKRYFTGWNAPEIKIKDFKLSEYGEPLKKVSFIIYETHQYKKICNVNDINMNTMK